jgi:hypothetical protein
MLKLQAMVLPSEKQMDNASYCVYVNIIKPYYVYVSIIIHGFTLKNMNGSIS